MKEILISLNNVYKIYNVGGEEVRALDGIDLEINENEYLAIMGPSGSGKSTLMNMIGCLDTGAHFARISILSWLIFLRSDFMCSIDLYK